MDNAVLFFCYYAIYFVYKISMKLSNYGKSDNYFIYERTPKFVKAIRNIRREEKDESGKTWLKLYADDVLKAYILYLVLSKTKIGRFNPSLKFSLTRKPWISPQVYNLQVINNYGLLGLPKTDMLKSLVCILTFTQYWGFAKNFILGTSNVNLAKQWIGDWGMHFNWTRPIGKCYISYETAEWNDVV